MSALVICYMDAIANGRLPGPDSEEAKEFRAWSWAMDQLEKIRTSIDWD